MNRLLAVRRSSPFHRIGFHTSKTLTSQHVYFSSSSDDNQKMDNKTGTGSGFIDKYFGKEATQASPEFSNRWAMAVPAFVTHMCIGSPWAWSLMVKNTHACIFI